LRPILDFSESPINLFTNIVAIAEIGMKGSKLY